MATTQKGITLEQFLKLPEKKPALEFEEGRVIQKVSPTGRHSRLQLALCTFVNRLTEPERLALALPELRATFGGRSYVPDVSVYLWDRLPVDAQGDIADDFFEPPDLAVEVRSPEQSVAGQITRCQWYVDNGVRTSLLLNPDDQSILLFLPGAAVQVLHGDDPIDLDAIIPGLLLTPAQLFASLRVR